MPHAGTEVRPIASPCDRRFQLKLPALADAFISQNTRSKCGAADSVNLSPIPHSQYARTFDQNDFEQCPVVASRGFHCYSSRQWSRTGARASLCSSHPKMQSSEDTKFSISPTGVPVIRGIVNSRSMRAALQSA